MEQLKTLKMLIKFQICAIDLRMKLKLMTLKILSLMKVSRILIEVIKTVYYYYYYYL